MCSIVVPLLTIADLVKYISGADIDKLKLQALEGIEGNPLFFFGKSR